jgi:hypothetical protein
MHHLHRSAMSSSSSISSSLNSAPVNSMGEAATATPLGGSSTPTGSTATRHRRNQSVSADAPNVITTDKIRPDWAKKLADMRAHALRRAAAATALHNAAYMLGNLEAQGFQRGESSRSGVAVFRRRRGLFFGGANSASPGTPGEEVQRQNSDEILNAGRSVSTGDIFPGRMSSLPGGRRSRMEDLEELMMMEAIRQSIAAEEERKQKEEAEKLKEKDKPKDGAAPGNAMHSLAVPTPSPSLRSGPQTPALSPLGTSLPILSLQPHPLSMSMSVPRSPTTSASASSSTSDVLATNPAVRAAGRSAPSQRPTVSALPAEASTESEATGRFSSAEASGASSALLPTLGSSEKQSTMSATEEQKAKGKGKEPVFGGVQ